MKKQFNRIVPVIALLIKWSGLAVVDGRNKIGGTVFGTGKGGAFARNKVTPINRRSSRQSQTRAVFSSFSQQFRTLGASTIAAWNALAQDTTYNNIFGDSKKWSGIALFIKLNMNLSKSGGTNITAAPLITDQAQGALGFLPVSDVSSANIFVSAIFTGLSALVPAGNTLVVSATRKLSAGITSPSKSNYRIINDLPAASDTTSFNCLTAYVGVFGSAPAVGDNIWLMIESVNDTSGFSSVAFSGKLAISA